MNLKDGVKTTSNTVSSETRKLSNFVLNKTKPLVDRLECFEDIISLEVGDTGLNRAKALERKFNIRQLFVKYEGDNPTGTQKDRIAFAQVYDALRREFDKLAQPRALQMPAYRLSCFHLPLYRNLLCAPGTGM